MTEPRLTADFQPMAAEGRPGGMERVWHEGTPTTLDITPFVLGLDAKGVRELHEEAGTHGKDLDYVAEAIPGFVEANTGKGGFDLLLDPYDIDDFFEAHGMNVQSLTDGDLESLRQTYGVERGAIPFVEGQEPVAPKGP